MIRKIVPTKDPKLRAETREVKKIDKKILDLLEDMHETLKAQKDPQGVGLAATQIGHPLKIFMMVDRGRVITIFNPKIVKLSKSDNDPKDEGGEYIMEGCLSLPHFYGPVKRSWKVELKYDEAVQKENGDWKLEPRHETFEGFVAQIIQHETDHLNGKLFIDRLLEQNRQLYQLKNKEWHEVELQ
jgi:peptide deformylase